MYRQLFYWHWKPSYGMDHTGMDHTSMDHTSMDHTGMDLTGMDLTGMDIYSHYDAGYEPDIH